MISSFTEVNPYQARAFDWGGRPNDDPRPVGCASSLRVSSRVFLARKLLLTGVLADRLEALAHVDLVLVGRFLGALLGHGLAHLDLHAHHVAVLGERDRLAGDR